MVGLNIKNTRYMQYLSAVIATLSIACCSMHASWTSPVLPKLTSSDSPIGILITKEEGSWIAASPLLGSIPGSCLISLILNKIGRKRMLLMSAIICFLPWLIIIFSKSVLVICVTRVFAGSAVVFATTGSVMYNGEIAEKDIRGKLGSTFQILSLCGIFGTLTVGPFISYTALNISCSIAPLIFAVIIHFIPESPYYLVKVGKIDEARASLVTLSRNNASEKFIEERLKEIQETIADETKNNGTLWELLSKAEHRKALFVMTGVKTFQQLSGSLAIQGYMQTIIKATDSNVSPEVSSIIFGFIQIPAALLAAALVDRVGRKPLIILSALGCALAHIGEGIYFYLQDFVGADTSSITWLPTSGIVLFVVMNSLGLFTLPYVLLGEIFQANVKGTAVTLFTWYGGMIGFTAVKVFEPISTAWGAYTIFWIFAGFCILGAMFFLFALPETKGKSLDEIQKTLNKNIK